jgi:hypothetical protein
MRFIALCTVLLTAGSAIADKDKKSAAIADATKTIDAGDAAFNAHDAKAMIALLDAGYFSCAARVSTCTGDADEIRRGFEAGYERAAKASAKATRDKLLIGADDTGTIVWFIADYTFHFDAKDGASERKVRESGTLVKHGKLWRFVMLHSAWPAPDEPK